MQQSAADPAAPGPGPTAAGPGRHRPSQPAIDPDAGRSEVGSIIVLAAGRGLALAMLAYLVAIFTAREVGIVADHAATWLWVALAAWAGTLVPELLGSGDARSRGRGRWYLRWTVANLSCLLVAVATALPALAIIDGMVGKGVVLGG